MRLRLLTRGVVSVLTALAATASGDQANAHGSQATLGDPSGDGARPGASPYHNALRIARSLHDEGLVARLLAMRGMTKGAADADLVAVIDAHEAAGTPELAVDFLRARIRRYPSERSPRLLLARLLTRSGRSRESVAAYTQQIERFGHEALSLEDAQRYARDLSRIGEIASAHEVLLRYRATAAEDATSYWIDLATLAWEREDFETALVAYEHAYRLAPQTVHAAARLMTLLADAGRKDDAVRVAMAEHERSGDASSALFAAHLLAKEADWAGLRAAISTAERSPGALSTRSEWFVLKGEAAKHLGDLAEASRAYAAALALDPDDSTVRASALWTAIEREDQVHVRTYVDRFREGARQDATLWLPMAHGLASLGRPRESALWLSRAMGPHPRDPRLLLDFGDAMEALGNGWVASDLRRCAMSQLSKELVLAARSRQRSEEDLHLIESAALALHARRGASRADPWMTMSWPRAPRSARGSAARTLRRPRGDAERAADWYLTTGRPEYARRVIASTAAEPLGKQRLALALVDGDPTRIKALLDELPTGGAEEDRAHALVALERDRDAMAAMTASLARAPDRPDAPAMSEELARLTVMHRPHVRAGVVYEHVTGLDVAGPTVAASHDALGGRLTYSASASRMRDGGRQLLLRGPRDEAEVGALLRVSSLRAVTDLSAAVDYQSGAPVARAALFDQRRLGSRLGVTTELRAGSRIFDTSFLRVTAVRNSAAVGLRYELTRGYFSAEFEGREEHTRKYEHLAWDAIGTMEAGVKLTSREPYVSVGPQLQASQRAYPTRLPNEVTTLLSPNMELVRALPPSFQLVSGVVHLSRGDVWERSRPERSPFPRYDCEAAFGALLPDTDVAAHVLCGVSLRAPGGHTTLFAFYNRGVAGVKNNENAELALSYTLSL